MKNCYKNYKKIITIKLLQNALKLHAPIFERKIEVNSHVKNAFQCFSKLTSILL